MMDEIKSKKENYEMNDDQKNTEKPIDLEFLRHSGEICTMLASMDLPKKVECINLVRDMIHEVSPFKSEPVDLIRWVPVDGVKANDYNPNSVAPPEMELLRHSINHDGYTQPVVTWMDDDSREVIDGFHRTRVCKELDDVNARVHGYLPVVTIKDDCSERSDRMASTIRHNRARGKHRVDSMSEIVLELKKRNWSDKRVAKELGMDEDEILRLCQVSGLSDLFDDADFTNSWEIGIFDDLYSGEDLFDSVEPQESGQRIYHTWDKWECFDSGFYGSAPPKGMTKDECEQKYCEMLSDKDRFKGNLARVIDEWPNSCEHYLSNDKMNRIAWLGQASMAIDCGIPACFRGGYNLLTDEQKDVADNMALDTLNVWLVRNDRPALSAEDANSKTKANIY